MSRVLRAVSASACLVMMWGLLASASPPPGETSFGVHPGHYQANDLATRSYFNLSLDPGSTYSDTVDVVNFGTSGINLRTGPVEGLTGATQDRSMRTT